MNTTKAEKEYRILTDTEFLNDKKYKIEGCYSDYDSTFNQTLHFHDFYELSIIYEGESGFLITGVALTMSVGGALRYSAGEVSKREAEGIEKGVHVQRIADVNSSFITALICE